MQRDYELGIVINPDVGDEQARAIVERMTQFVTTNGGQVVRVNAWGRRHLAYPIQHHRDGLFFWFDLMLPTQVVAELERTLRVNEDVIRHLVTLRDPRVIAQTRQREADADAQQAAQQAAQAAQQAAAQAAQQAAAQQATVAEAPVEPVAEPVAEAAPEPTAAASALATEPTSGTEEQEVVASGVEAEA